MSQKQRSDIRRYAAELAATGNKAAATELLSLLP